MADRNAFLEDLIERFDLNRQDKTPTNVYIAGMREPIRAVTHMGIDGEVVIISAYTGVFYVAPDAVIGMGCYEGVEDDEDD